MAHTPLSPELLSPPGDPPDLQAALPSEFAVVHAQRFDLVENVSSFLCCPRPGFLTRCFFLRHRRSVRPTELSGYMYIAGRIRYSSFREKLLEIYDAAEVTKPEQPWHCMRHAFCTTLARAKEDIYVIQELAGHRSIETTRRYIHVNEAQKRAAIQNAFG